MKLTKRVSALTMAAAIVAAFLGAGAPSAAATDGGRGERRDHRLERLAQEQSKLWADGLTGSFNGPLSPAGCDFRQPERDVFMLPVNTGLPGTPAVTCTLRSSRRVLADLGGFVPFEDANGVAGGYTLKNGTTVPFTPENLVTICTDIMDQGVVPAPKVTLDGHPSPVAPQVVITDPFIYRVPAGWLLEDDSAQLGHPGKLAATYCGYKLLLPRLERGTHQLIGTAFGTPITWTIEVVH